MMRAVIGGWNQFWFTPQPRAAMTWPRVAICLVASAWFASFWGSAPAWFSTDGLLAQPLATRILAADQIPAWQAWSPLWLTQSSGLIRAWLAAGIGLSLLAASGLGGRLTLVVLWLWVVAWANRLLAISGLVEPMLIACLGYLIVEPGLPLLSAAPLSAAPRASSQWSAGLALRLLQTHWWLLVAAGLLSQLGGLVWWRGEGVWWLAAAGRSNLLTIEMLRGHPIVINALSHAVILVQMLALWTLTITPARPLGIAFAVLVAGVYGVIADHGLLALLLLAVLTSFCQPTISASAGHGANSQ